MLYLCKTSQTLNIYLVAIRPCSQANSLGVVEEQYVFLKRVCQLLVQLGTSQLALLWVSEKLLLVEKLAARLVATLGWPAWIQSWWI